ncbi:hypothetical protein [Bradyrhizobium sp. 1(2017)]|uniref:hypothetical protein n=1 Tax=Bradyrhizobium sp. 1(2017) TaxID=1404888 RepID=UPI00140EB074|nr:hypothetical protein [Bradyrhizobium sp. 1(2017)]QIO34887.1 hypothetical protein HAP40_25320 [Bradyrhizobium sp. 1(2017)]
MKTGLLVIALLVTPGAHSAVIGAECSSYYISEITLVSPADTEAGHVQVFVGFGASKEEAEKNALGSCSHIKLDLQTCPDSDRVLGRNAPPDKDGSALHLKYMKAVKRITGCDLRAPSIDSRHQEAIVIRQTQAAIVEMRFERTYPSISPP